MISCICNLKLLRSSNDSNFIKEGMARKRNETNGLEDGHMKIKKVEIVNCKLHSFYRWGNGTGM